MAVTWVASSISTVPITWRTFSATKEVDTEKTLSSVKFEIVNDDAGFSFYVDDLSLTGNLEDLPDPVGAEGTVHNMRFPNITTGSTYECPIFVPYEECKINAVYVAFNAGLTGHDTNYMTLQIINKGTDGSGTDVMAELAFTTGTDATAYDLVELTVDTTKDTAEEGAVITLKKIESGGGMNMPEGLLIIFWEPNISAL